ncbi:unnamed protein product, partial [Rotaria magnacalcarata]
VQNERAPRHGATRGLSLPPPPPPPPIPRMQCWTPPTAAGYVNESPQVTIPFGFRNLTVH